MQAYQFVGASSIAANGKAMLYASCNAAATGADPRVEVIADGQSLGLFNVGDDVALPRAADRWEVRPLSASPVLSGVVKIGNGRARVAGSSVVEVLDSSAQRTMQARQLFMSWSVVGPTDTRFPAVGVFSAAKKIAVRQLRFRSSTASAWFIYKAAGFPDSAPLVGTSQGLRNKLIGQPESTVLEWRAWFDARPPSAAQLPVSVPLGVSMGTMEGQANEWCDVVTATQAPWVLLPGWSIFVTPQTALQQTIWMQIDAEEID